MAQTVSKEYYAKNHTSGIGIFEITNVHHNALKALQAKNGQNILDIGSGNGELISLLVENGTKATGIDFSEKSVEVALKHSPSAEIIVGDIRKLNFEKEVFDKAVSLGTLGYLNKKDLAEHFISMAKILKPRALYVIRVSTPLNKIGVLILKLLHPKYESSTYFYSKSLYNKSAKQGGFALKKTWRSYDSPAPSSILRKILRYILFPFLSQLWITFEKQ